MYHLIKRVSQIMAMLGGIMLGFLIVLICVSVVGRSLSGILHSDAVMGAVPGVATWLLNLGIGPVNGDFELVEAGIAFSIFAFLPLAHVTGGHATVDIFTNNLSQPVSRVLSAIIDSVFAAVLVLLAIQLAGGLETKFRSGETTLLLQFPVWWGYALSLFAAVVTAGVGVLFALLRLTAVFTGTQQFEDEGGAGH